MGKHNHKQASRIWLILCSHFPPPTYFAHTVILDFVSCVIPLLFSVNSGQIPCARKRGAWPLAPKRLPFGALHTLLVASPTWLPAARNGPVAQAVEALDQEAWNDRNVDGDGAGPLAVRGTLGSKRHAATFAKRVPWAPRRCSSPPLRQMQRQTVAKSAGLSMSLCGRPSALSNNWLITASSTSVTARRSLSP